MYLLGTSMISVLVWVSISCSASRFSLMRKVATSTGSWAITLAVRSLRASSPIRRSSVRASDSTLRIRPMPLQRGQA